MTLPNLPPVEATVVVKRDCSAFENPNINDLRFELLNEGPVYFSRRILAVNCAYFAALFEAEEGPKMNDTVVTLPEGLAVDRATLIGLLQHMEGARAISSAEQLRRIYPLAAYWGWGEGVRMFGELLLTGQVELATIGLFLKYRDRWRLQRGLDSFLRSGDMELLSTAEPEVVLAVAKTALSQVRDLTQRKRKR